MMLTADILGERARLTPGKTALVLVANGARYTYAELNDRAARCAAAWQQGLGIGKGDRIGLLAGNRVEYVEALFAAAKSGAILVPLGTRLTPPELEQIVEDAGLRALVYGGDFCPTVRALRALTTVPRWVALDEPAAAGDDRMAALLERAGARSTVSARSDPEDPCCLLYTSGTTGAPKGVVLPHRMIAWNGYNTAISWQLRDNDVSPVFTPLYHAGGLGAFLVPVLTVGGTIVLHSSFDPAEVWRTIERERCTVVLGVPTIFKLLMEAPEFERAEVGHVRWFISGGAPLPVYLVEAYRRRGIVLKQGYGLTEVGVNCFAMSAEEAWSRAGSIGRPMMFTEARLRAGDGSDQAGAGEIGELLLRGPHVCNGYWRNPQATSAALDADGWFHTGDLARRDTDGFYYIVGRAKDMFISGGVNVYPAEIENVLLLHPAVQDAAGVGVPSPKWGEVGVAFVVARSPVRADELEAHLAGRLASFKHPKEYVFVDSLPRTAYGKVVKGQLRDAYLSAGGAPRPGR